MIRILIADDHSIVRYGINQLTKEMYDDQVHITGTHDFSHALDLVGKQPFDLLIIDIKIQGGDHVQMIEIMRLRNPKLRILIFSGLQEQLFGVTYLQAGANGYLMKNAQESEIRNAIKVVLNNEIYTSNSMRQYILRHISGKKDPERNPIHLLSSRESEVLHQLVKGMPVANIAKMMNLQISTISTYKTRIYEKMNVTNVVELVEKVKICITA